MQTKFSGPGIILLNGVTTEPTSGNEGPSKSKVIMILKKWRRGKLCKLNFDVLFLIAEYIHPIDVLNLARTCKSLRELLMDRASEFIWKTARQQVQGLPDCPADLTEPEYANLLFCDHCHCCGKRTKNVFWNIRRRYCNKCIEERLRRHSSCNNTILANNVIPEERITIKRDYCIWLDRDQVASFMREYRRCPDKGQFINDKKNECKSICQHAEQCEVWYKAWKNKKTSKRIDYDNPYEREMEREERIFERLEQRGYGREIEFFGRVQIRQRHSSYITIQPLIDQDTMEWDHILPEWLEIMTDLRSRRLERVVYQRRRMMLASEYDNYLVHPSSDTPTFDLLPYVVDLAHFSPFRDIIKAPEGAQIGDKPFASAFGQLPIVVAGWRKKVDSELAEMVKIPSHLFSEDAFNRQVTVSSRTGRELKADLNKLQLACALFCTNRVGVFTHLEAFSTATRRCWVQEDWEHVKFTSEIRYLEEAPYIIYACGLDPSAAKVDDMNRRNARLNCLCCHGYLNVALDWRNALLHARSYHQPPHELAPLSQSPRWKLVADEHINAIQAIEQTMEKSPPRSVRCLLCRPHVGDALWYTAIQDHLYDSHDIWVDWDDIEQGVQYAPLGICHAQSMMVEMVEEGEQVTFRLRRNP